MSNDDVVKNKCMMAVSLEVVDIFLRTSKLLFDTDTSKVMTSNVDQTVSAEDKSDNIAINSSYTRKFPDFRWTMCQVRWISKKPFDSAGKVPQFYLTMRWKEWLKTRMQYAIQSTFVFCPMPKSIEMDNIMAQEFHLPEKMSLMFLLPSYMPSFGKKD